MCLEKSAKYFMFQNFKEFEEYIRVCHSLHIGEAEFGIACDATQVSHCTLAKRQKIRKKIVKKFNFRNIVGYTKTSIK